MELSKGEKKLARQCIDKGVQAEFKAALERVKKIVDEWDNAAPDHRETYYKLFKAVNEQDKRIARRYDGMRGSRYLLTVADIYADGQITEEDIAGFSEETKAVLLRWAGID